MQIGNGFRNKAGKAQRIQSRNDPTVVKVCKEMDMVTQKQLKVAEKNILALKQLQEKRFQKEKAML